MKNLMKTMIGILLLAGMSGQLAAHTFKITNNTNQKINVKLFSKQGGLLGGPKLINAGKIASFESPQCLGKIKVKQARQWKNVDLVREQAPGASFFRALGTVVTLGQVEICESKNFNLKINQKTGKMIAVQK